MKNFGLKQCSLVSLLATSSLALAAEHSPFEKQDYEPRQKTSDCRILEFTCSTCGHMTDEEMWTKDNKLIADIETCEQKRKERQKKARQ
jgi:hypothetical protein